MPLFHFPANFLNSFLDSSDDRSLKNTPLYQVQVPISHSTRGGRPTECRGQGRRGAREAGRGDHAHRTQEKEWP